MSELKTEMIYIKKGVNVFKGHAQSQNGRKM